ncbi:Tetratricopeptide-like helical domain [Phytophthora cactorum]|nr:Tetratricopeptide-like helical domain [Phytophthora cactorum]
MSHFYRHDTVCEAPPRPRSAKRNPLGTDYSPSKRGAHLERKSNHDSDQSLLAMLNSTVACLKQKKMDLEALGCLEQSLWLKRRMFGVDSSAVLKALNEVMLSYNSVAMQYLAQGQFDQCLAMKLQAMPSSTDSNFNNIGCCYRKLGKLKSALKGCSDRIWLSSCEESIHYAPQLVCHSVPTWSTRSGTGTRTAAIFHTQEELVGLEDGARDEDDSDQNALDPKTREEKIISLAVAYHNLAVELEFNGRGEASLQWYKKALQLVWKYRESNEALCESFKKIFLDAKKKQQTANIRQNGIPASAFTANKGRRPVTRPNLHMHREHERVASQCYKSTKPSTAGLRYATGNGKPLRPASATTRQRPMSAKPSTRTNYRRGPRDSAEIRLNCTGKSWKRNMISTIFKLLLGRKLVDLKARATQRRQKLQGQLYFGAPDEDFIGNDEDYGVINDDGSSDDDLDNYPCNNQQERLRGRPVNSRKQRSISAAVGSRHRRALDDSRSRTSLDLSETISDSEAGAVEERCPSVTHTGYNGDDDTDSDLPAQRVCHMEYLRRSEMGRGFAWIEAIQLIVNVDQDATSKLRDQIEQARRDSLDNLHEVESRTGKLNEVKTTTPVTKHKNEDDGLKLQEDVHVFYSEGAARDAELQLFREAASCRLQAFFRGQRCRTEVKQLKQVKRQNTSACLIQRRVRKYLEVRKEVRRLDEERLQLELQREEVEDMAACIIQRLWRRALSTSAARSQDGEEDEKPSPVPQRRPFSIADVVLGAAVNKSVGSSQTLLNQRPPEPPPLNPAVSVPHNLSRQSERETPRRSSTVSSISLNDPNGVGLSSKAQEEQSARSDTYDDDEEWIAQSPRPAQSTPRTTRSTHPTPCLTPRTSRRTIEEADTRRQNAAATRIQASTKSFIVRRRIALKNASDLTRSYIERRHFSVTLDQTMALELGFLEELSAVKIQALVRGRQSRLLTECTKAGVYTAATTIQRSFRVHRQNTQRAVDEGVRSIAARTIQQVFRDYEARRAAVHQAVVDEELLSVQQIAANTIQNFWRQYFTAYDHNLEEIEAATCIQALSRGHLTRKSMKSLHGSSSGLSKHSSAFSMSSAEKLFKGDNSVSKETLSINYSFLPPKIRELYMSSENQTQSSNNQIHAQEIAELGLTFPDFLRELETCTDMAVAISALNAMRIVLETSPESTKTLANVVKVAQALDRRLQDGFWSDDIETSTMALLHAFRDVLDAQ